MPTVINHNNTGLAPTDNYTYSDLIKDLWALTTEQQNQQVRWIDERGNGKVRSLWVLSENHIDPSGEGLKPVSTYPEMSAEELAIEQTWPAGLVMLSHE